MHHNESYSGIVRAFGTWFQLSLSVKFLGMIGEGWIICGGYVRLRMKFKGGENISSRPNILFA
jgi:hypothetical protein